MKKSMGIIIIISLLTGYVTPVSTNIPIILQCFSQGFGKKMRVDENGNATVLASEHRGLDGKMKLLTYDAASAEDKAKGILTKGKVYEQDSSGKYGKETSGEFVIKEILSTAGLSNSGKAVLKALGAGADGQARIVYQETIKNGATREVSMNKKTGGLEYVATTDGKGKSSVIVFDPKVLAKMKENGEGDGAIDFNSLKADDQTKVLSSLPVMDNRDSSAITAKLASVQDGLNQAKMKKLAEEKGWKFDGEKSQLLLPIPKGIGAEGDTTEYKGIQVLRMGEDANGSLVFEGRLLVDQGGKLTPSGPEVYVADAGSEFVKALLRVEGIDKTIETEESKEITKAEVKTDLNNLEVVKNLEARSMKAEESGLVRGIKNVVGRAIGFVMNILGGGIFDKKTIIRFDTREGKPAVIVINGMRNKQYDINRMTEKVQEAFGVNSLTAIYNGSYLFGLLDIIQSVIGYEILGSIDKDVMNTVEAIRQGIKEKGEVFVVAHSQGTKIFEMALNLLTAEERSKVHYYGAGGECFVDGEAKGLADARNVWNEGDKIPQVNNIPLNFIGIDRMGREKIEGGAGNTEWASIKVEGKGNKHEFKTFYLGDMESWANKKIEEQGYEKNNVVNNDLYVVNGTSELRASERGLERRSDLQAYGGESLQDEDGIYNNGRQKALYVSGDRERRYAIAGRDADKVSGEILRTEVVGDIASELGVQNSKGEAGRINGNEFYNLQSRDNKIERSAVERENNGRITFNEFGNERSASAAVSPEIRGGSEVDNKTFMPNNLGNEKESTEKAVADFLNNLEDTDTVIAVVKGKDVVVNVVGKDEKIKNQITVETKTLAKAVDGLKNRKADTANKTNAKSAKVNDSKLKASQEDTAKTTTLKEKTVEVAKTLEQLTEGIKESVADSLGKIGGEGLTVMLKAGPAAWLSPTSIFAAGSNPMPEISNTFKEITGNEMTVADVKEVKSKGVFSKILDKTVNIASGVGKWLINAGKTVIVDWIGGGIKATVQFVVIKPIMAGLTKIGLVKKSGNEIGNDNLTITITSDAHEQMQKNEGKVKNGWNKFLDFFSGKKDTKPGQSVSTGGALKQDEETIGVMTQLKQDISSMDTEFKKNEADKQDSIKKGFDDGNQAVKGAEFLAGKGFVFTKVQVEKVQKDLGEYKTKFERNNMFYKSYGDLDRYSKNDYKSNELNVIKIIAESEKVYSQTTVNTEFNLKENNAGKKELKVDANINAYVGYKIDHKNIINITYNNKEEKENQIKGSYILQITDWADMKLDFGYKNVYLRFNINLDWEHGRK